MGALLTLDQVIAKNKVRLDDPHVHTVVRDRGYELIRRMYKKNIWIIFVQAFRSIEYQNQLYSQGRFGHPGEIVTNAKGGSSAHNYGLALDYTILLADGRTISWNDVRDGNHNGLADWLEVAREAENLGFEWGGHWEFVDKPHIQMLFGLTIKQLIAGKRPSNVIPMPAPKPVVPKVNPTVLPRPKLPAVNVWLNGKDWVVDGYIYNDRSYLPIRAFTDAVGGKKLGWDAAKQMATIDGALIPSTIIQDQNGDGQGEGYALTSELCEVYKKTVTWDSDLHSVKIA
jgi:peptidoglycan L-alanyl-D-glutamate endopeptidase CwlK